MIERKRRKKSNVGKEERERENNRDEGKKKER